MLDTDALYVASTAGCEILVYPNRLSNTGYWSCGVIRGVQPTILAGDVVMLLSNQMRKATKWDFIRFRVVYPQGYSN